MKLIHQTKLEFKEGTSDKVYEVELCEVGVNKFVVNFRYGRRGAALKEGTKTTSPVDRTSAQLTFDKLVKEKTDKGYVDVARHSPAPAPQAEAAPKPEDSAQAQQGRAARILEVLRAQDDSGWSLTRAVWRAGELGLEQAQGPLLALIPLAHSSAYKDAQRRDLLLYCVAWALGRLGDQASLSALESLQTQAKADRVRRVASYARREVLARQGRLQELTREIVASLPVAIAQAHRAQDADGLQRAIEAQLRPGHGPDAAQVIVELYQIDDQVARQAVLRFIQHATLKVPHFRVLRRLFKMAELRRDGQVFGLIAHRVATTPANYKLMTGYYTRQHSLGKADDGKVRQLAEWRNGAYKYSPLKSVYITEPGSWARETPIGDMTSEQTRYAYGEATRDYLIRRTWRALKRLGELGSPDYVKMATGVLLPFKDSDAVEPKRVSRYRYDWQTNSSSVVTHVYGGFAPFKALNHVLFTGSTRVRPNATGMFWYDEQLTPPQQRKAKKGKAQAAQAAPAAPAVKPREEAWPELWDATPVALLHLLDESRCALVHEFAVRALGDNASFCDALELDAIMMMLAAPYEGTARFGFELFQSRYDAANPDLEGLVRVATCAYKPARVQAVRWLEPLMGALRAQPALLARLITGPEEAIAHADRALLGHRLADDAAQELLWRVLATLLSYDQTQAQQISRVSALLLERVKEQLRVVGLSVIRDLLMHPLVELQVLGAELLLRKGALHISDEHIETLLASAHVPVRAMGVRLFGELSDAQLLDREQLVLALLVHQEADLRAQAQGIIARLAHVSPDFGRRTAALCVDALLVPERVEGVHSDLLRVLSQTLMSHLAHMPKAEIYKLLRAQGSAAQELGGLLLQGLRPEQLELLEIVELGRHEILAVREACWTMMEGAWARFTAAPATALRVVDSPWEDTRRWAFARFEASWGAKDWTPELLVSVCDSTRHDVQAWGKRLIQTYFEESRGQDYLLRLSEHPSIDLQLFATNYLERFASDSPDRLDALTFYFTSILSRVNRGGVAKARVFDFFEREALKSEDAAQVIGAILARQSATITIRDKARAIALMTRLRQRYPALELPLTLKPVEARHGV